MKNFDTDVLIVGGGPAGAAAAISLLNYGNNISVTVIEQSDLDSRRVGEHVSAGIFGLLDYLKLSKEDFGPDCFVPTYGNTSYWGISQPILRDSILTTESSSYQLDREQFDLTLLDHVAEMGGNVFPRTKFSQIVQWFDDGRVLPHDLQLETVENGWWYSAVLPKNVMTITFFSDADIISKNNFHKPDGWLRLLDQTLQLKRLVKGANTNEALWVKNAHTQISNSMDREHFLAIGDAAAAFDPISSMGIGFAITSACHAAEIVLAELVGHDPKRIQTYQDDINNNFRNYYTLRQKIYQQERRWPSADFWMRRSA